MLIKFNLVTTHPDRSAFEQRKKGRHTQVSPLALHCGGRRLETRSAAAIINWPIVHTGEEPVMEALAHSKLRSQIYKYILIFWAIYIYLIWIWKYCIKMGHICYIYICELKKASVLNEWVEEHIKMLGKLAPNHHSFAQLSSVQFSNHRTARTDLHWHTYA